MSVSSLQLELDDFCVLRGEIVDKLLLASNPDAALLYLYITRAKKSFNEKKALEHLNFSKERFDRAIFDLISMKAVSEVKTEPKSVAFVDKPKYSVSDIRDARKDDHFSAVCMTAESIIGKVLSEGYVKSLLYIYSELKLPAEVIIELLAYLKDKTKSAPKRTDIEREAHSWIDMGIATHADATNFIEKKMAEKPIFDSMMAALKIYGRDPQPVEERYISQYISYGFSADAVELCVEKMHQTTNKFSFSYLNGILKNLKDKNLFTSQEILNDNPEFIKDTKKNRNSAPVVERTGALEQWEVDFINELKREGY